MTLNPRLPGKANRLFPGSVGGGIIELLQNARRAAATRVAIANKDGHITRRNNGQGIGDFSNLLDVGQSGWEDRLAVGEARAGVGVFCLAPRKVTIHSNGK